MESRQAQVTNCRICGQALPAGDGSLVVICSSCGAVSGAGPEIEAHAALVAAGRTVAKPPAALSHHRLKVQCEPLAAAGNRHGGSAAESPATLTIRMSYFGLRTAGGLLLGLGAVAGLAYTVHLSMGANLFIPAAVAAVPVVVFLCLRVAAAFDSLLIRVADDRLLVRSRRRRWAFPIGQIQQLFVARQEPGYTLFASTAEPEARPLLERIADPALAWYLEQQLKAVLGLGDRPLSATVPKSRRQPLSAVLLGSVALQLGIVAVVLGSAVGFLHVVGAELGEVVVIDEPKKIALVVPKPGRVFFTAEVDLVDGAYSHQGVMPHSIEFHIQLTRDGLPVGELTCDPLKGDAWVTNEHEQKVGRFWGPMDNCALEISEPGEHTLEVWRTWKPGVPPLRANQTILGARQR